ncbi:3-deoxy-7-phosphoheptulonate synthase [Desulfitibacter alkalitolerans]|uniref:3-deoxy-7-phosphoheptulonate synthase n=1 Tax=Desulfitibacter alkalitolerans TaxID=264641 RepID=UPI000489F22B|nr:3-deoxy-7-phosphoheptulonate synthase [Desulfitibacter alkalitolerans]
MVVVMKNNSTPEQIKSVTKKLEKLGFKTHIIHGTKRIVIGAIGTREDLETMNLERLPGVERIVPIMKPFKLVSREAQETDSIINIKGVNFGGNNITVIAGPCAIESREQLLTAAHMVKKAGAQVLRGGAFKPRTSPYAFQGLEEEGLKLLREASQLTGLVTVTEVIDERSLNMSMDYVDILQIGARNMHNFQLLKVAGQSGKPILLKRGLSATIEEWLMSAEYIMAEGNNKVILCERGIRTFETYTRNTLDLSAVSLVRQLSHLPVIVDPSHSTGNTKLVPPMSLAALAAGANGLIIEMHPDPSTALCDGHQSLTPDELNLLMKRVTRMLEVLSDDSAVEMEDVVNG